jgi:nucleoside-diphosphate-sugar epimerase
MTPLANTPSDTPSVRPTAPDARPLAVVLGASGRLGAAAVDAFAAAGWRVLAQTRSRPLSAPQPARGQGVAETREPTVQAITTPLDTADAIDTIAAAAAGAQVVLHAVNPPYTRWAQEALPALRQGLDLARRLGARFVLPGNVYNHGESMPALLRPDTPQQATTRKGRLRCRMEEAMQAAARDGVRCTVLRAGDFFGAGRGTWFDVALVKDIGRGRLVYPGPLDRAHAWAYLPDLARAMVAVARADLDARQRPAASRQPDFETLHFAGHTLTGAELLTAIEGAAASIGLQPPRGWRRAGMPWPLIRAGGWLIPMWREIAEMAYLWERPHALDGQALAQRVGPLPVTPIDIALRQALLDLGHGIAEPHGRPRTA